MLAATAAHREQRSGDALELPASPARRWHSAYGQSQRCGRVVQTGTPAEVTQRPRSRYVADLVGVNLFRGIARAGQVALSGGAVVQSAEGIDGDVFATVHPRAVALHRGRPEGSPRNVWRGRASALDFQGDRVRVGIAGEMPIVAEVTPAAVRDLDLAEGSEVWVSVKATEISVYPA